MLGLVMTLLALLDVAHLIISWLTSGAGLFFDTRAVVLNATLLVWGLQILSAALFLSIFSGRLQRAKPVTAG
jgi:hypothetical protein